MAKKFIKPKMFKLPTTNDRIEKFVNYIMRNGKKMLARKIFAMCLEEIKKSWHPNPIAVWEWAIENASPNVMVKSKRIWGAVYQVPLEVPQHKRFFFASKWILDAARNKKWKPMYKKLAEEILAAYTWQWAAIKKKEDAHRMAEANEAFAYLAKYVK